MQNVLLVTLLAGLFGSNLAAQDLRLQATIPFDFQVGKASLPAGNYIVSHVEGIIRLSHRGGGGSAAVITFSADRKTASPDRGTLVFNRYGNSYFLQAVQAPHSSTARFLQKAKEELALAKSQRAGEVVLASAERKRR